MNSWLLFALALVVCTSALGILFRMAALRSKDPRVFSFLLNATALVIVSVLVLVNGLGEISIQRSDVWLIFLSSLGYGMFQRFQFLVRKQIEASRIGILFAPTGLAGYLLAIVWLNESVTTAKIFGYALIFLAVLLILYKKSAEKLALNRYVIITLLIGMGLSAAATIDRSVTTGFSSALTYTLIIWLAQTLACFFPRVSLTQAKQEIKRNKLFIPLLAVINIAATYFLISALQLAEATRVMPVASSNVIVIAILGIIFLKERDRMWIKLASACLATLGLVLVSQ